MCETGILFSTLYIKYICSSFSRNLHGSFHTISVYCCMFQRCNCILLTHNHKIAILLLSFSYSIKQDTSKARSHSFSRNTFQLLSIVDWISCLSNIAFGLSLIAFIFMVCVASDDLCKAEKVVHFRTIYSSSSECWTICVSWFCIFRSLPV